VGCELRVVGSGLSVLGCELWVENFTNEYLKMPQAFLKSVFIRKEGSIRSYLFCL
jgi:hypothetical protein